jgi:cytidylate kinase
MYMTQRVKKVTIFGWAGVGKSSTGAVIAQKLGFDFVSSGNLFRAMATRMKISPQELELRAKTDLSIDRAIDEMLVEIGKNEACVLVESRLAWHWIPHSIKVKFKCADEERYRRIALRDNLSIDEAVRQTQEREAAIIERYENLYSIKNFGSDRDFDLIFDTTTASRETTLELALDFITSSLKL